MLRKRTKLYGIMSRFHDDANIPDIWNVHKRIKEIDILLDLGICNQSRLCHILDVYAHLFFGLQLSHFSYFSRWSVLDHKQPNNKIKHTKLYNQMWYNQMPLLKVLLIDKNNVYKLVSNRCLEDCFAFENSEVCFDL